MHNSSKLPSWLRLAYGLSVAVISITYWIEYGASNFLWLSDIALACTAAAILTDIPLLASMPAVGVLFLELAWTVDFASGGRLIGGAAYMFDEQLSVFVRSLSLFHLALPPTLIYLMYRLGYDRRALLLQTLVTWVALLISYFWIDPTKNINWVYGPGQAPQELLHPVLYLALEMVLLPLIIFLPTHLVLRRLFSKGR